MNYLELYNKYLSKRDKLDFCKNDVVNLLKVYFDAVEFPYKNILDLENYDFFEYDKIFTALTIKNEKILKKIYSEKEQESHNEEKKENSKSEKLYLKRCTEEEKEYNAMLLDEREGNRVDIILESKDGDYISLFEVRYCEEIDYFMSIFTTFRFLKLKNIYGDNMEKLLEIGLNEDEIRYIMDIEENINNDIFKDYLQTLNYFKLL